MKKIEADTEANKLSYLILNQEYTKIKTESSSIQDSLNNIQASLQLFKVINHCKH